MRDAKPQWIDLEVLFAPDRPTLGEIPQWYELGGHCSSCEREGHVDRWQLQQRIGEDALVYEIRPLLRCRKCGKKGSNTWIAKKAPR